EVATDDVMPGIRVGADSNSLYQFEGLDCPGALSVYWAERTAQARACDADGRVSVCSGARRRRSHRKRCSTERPTRLDFGANRGGASRPPGTFKHSEPAPKV